MITSSKKLIVKLSKKGKPYHCWIEKQPSDVGTFLIEEECSSCDMIKGLHAIHNCMYFLHNSIRIDDYDLIDDILNSVILERTREIKIKKILS